ncbi:MAG: hypothetical protein WAN86_22475 [Hyphomicrobiaceae bacterium]
MPCFRTFLVERSAYREMFLSGEPPTVSERGKGAGAEIDSLLQEIRDVVDHRQGIQNAPRLAEAG